MTRFSMMQIGILILTFFCATASAEPNTAQSLDVRYTMLPSDINLMSFLKVKIASDKITAGLPIDLTVLNGTVTISGQVTTDSDASHLIELVQSTQGVGQIITAQLKIQSPQQNFTDLTITAELRGLMLREASTGKSLPINTVTIETSNGIVYLSGTASNDQQVQLIISLARSIDNVKQVISSVVVKPM